MGGDSRSSPRYALEAAIEIRSPGGGTTGRTSNVSRGGFCAIVNAGMARGADVEVRIALIFDDDAFSEPLSLPARVVWATELGPHQHQLGASFRTLSENQRDYLDMFLRYLTEGSRRAEEAAAGDEPDDDDDDPFAS